MASDKTRELAKAAKNADWQQVVLNGGPPCFHLEGSRFCLRAERWGGHPSEHDFVSLAALLDAFERETRRDELKSFRDAHELGYVPAMGEFAAYYDTASIGSNWSEKELDRRIAALAQPTPEVKK